MTAREIFGDTYPCWDWGKFTKSVVDLNKNVNAYKIPWADHLMAWSTLASSKTIVGLLPPSSNVTALIFESAAALRIVRPTRVLPVNVILLIEGCEEIADPAVFPTKYRCQFVLVNASRKGVPYPVTTFTTPGGSPASLNKLARKRALKGVISDGYVRYEIRSTFKKRCTIPSKPKYFHTLMQGLFSLRPSSVRWVKTDG